MAPQDIAFVTYTKLPDGTDDDRLCFPFLDALGYTVHTPVWNDPAVDWAQFGVVIIRSCWDYYKNGAAFGAWLDRIAAAGVLTLNPIATVRWNLDKHYMLELEARGLDVLPAVYIKQGGAADLAAILRDRGWDQAVVKPTLSAGAYQTSRVAADEAAAKQADLDALLTQSGAIVQKFQPEIQTDGEWSLHFFNRVFSHAIIKRPNAGDFRIQGGLIEAATPGAGVLAQAVAIVAAVAGELLYARVDGLLIDGRLRLMELELIEPRLYLAFGEGAPERFAAAIDTVLSRLRPPSF